MAPVGSFNEHAMAVWDFARCQKPDGSVYGTSGKCRKGKEIGEDSKESAYSDWEDLARGNYGRVRVSPDGTRAVKTLHVGPDGKKGEFGEYELELATKMGELGHSPRVYKSTPDLIEMDAAKGAPLWKGYRRAEGEPVMDTEQATKAAAAIRDLHRMGYAHGDLHAQQFIVNGSDVKLVDFGLSVPTSRQPARVMQDLSKINGLVRWDNPELSRDPYVQIVNRHLTRYNEVQGTLKKAKAERERIGEEYLAELASLQ